jgi:Flp pilus assembly pilin Flp
VTHDTIPLVLVSVALVANVYVLARHLYWKWGQR